MGSQTAHGYPYPVGTDRVADGDNAIQALAEKIETRLRGGVWSGVVTMPSTAQNAIGSAVMTFPVGQFSAAPIVTATPSTGSPQFFDVGVQSPNVNGVTIYAFNSYSSPASVSVYVIAQLQGGAGVVLGATDGPPPPPTVALILTCHTAGCGNAGVAIPMDVPEGASITCGVCGEPITDVQPNEENPS